MALLNEGCPAEVPFHSFDPSLWVASAHHVPVPVNYARGTLHEGSCNSTNASAMPLQMPLQTCGRVEHTCQKRVTEEDGQCTVVQPWTKSGIHSSSGQSMQVSRVLMSCKRRQKNNEGSLYGAKPVGFPRGDPLSALCLVRPSSCLSPSIALLFAQACQQRFFLFLGLCVMLSALFLLPVLLLCSCFCFSLLFFSCSFRFYASGFFSSRQHEELPLQTFVGSWASLASPLASALSLHCL